MRNRMRVALARAMGVTQAEIDGLAMAAWALRDDLAIAYGIVSLLRRFADESDGGVAGGVLARIAARCQHARAMVPEGTPGAVDCALCGRTVVP